MKTKSILQAVLPLTLAAYAMGCASPAAPAGDTNQSDPNIVGDDNRAPSTPSSPPVSDAPPRHRPPRRPRPRLTRPRSRRRSPAAPVWAYAVSNDAVFVATDNTVERAAPDGTAVMTLPGLTTAMSLATDGARLYALLDQGSSAELYSTKPDGSDNVHHLSWNWGYGEPGALAVNGGRVYFSATDSSQRSNSMLVSIASPAPASPYDNPWRIEEYVDAQNLAPAFTADRLFAVDYYRQSAVRVSTVDASQSVDVIEDTLPTSAAGISTDGKDVYTRTTKGIVRVAIGSGANTDPIVVVPSATCSILIPADGSESMLDDVLVVDGATIYTACRAGATSRSAHMRRPARSPRSSRPLPTSAASRISASRRPPRILARRDERGTAVVERALARREVTGSAQREAIERDRPRRRDAPPRPARWDVRASRAPVTTARCARARGRETRWGYARTSSLRD